MVRWWWWWWVVPCSVRVVERVIHTLLYSTLLRLGACVWNSALERFPMACALTLTLTLTPHPNPNPDR